MTDSPQPKVRRSLFRAVALERYVGPIAIDTPHMLPSWRPGFVVAAALVAAAVILLWFWQ